MTTPRRRWSFSLRTMMGVTTLACCWLGYQLNWIRERHEFMALAKACETNLPIAVEGTLIAIPSNSEVFAPAPISLRFFGEPGVVAFIIPEASKPLRARATSLFPEATLSEVGAKVLGLSGDSGDDGWRDELIRELNTDLPAAAPPNQP